MLKRILIAALMWPLLALAQSYPSPHFNNLTVDGTLTNAHVAITGGSITGITALTGIAQPNFTGTSTSALTTDQAQFTSQLNNPTATAEYIYGAAIGAVGQSVFDSAGIRGVATQTAGSTNWTVDGLSGYVLNNQAGGVATKSAVGVFGVNICAVDNCQSWGMDSIVTDSLGFTGVTSGIGRQLYGNESDLNVSSPNTNGIAYFAGGTALTSSAYLVGFQVNKLGGGVGAKWNYAFVSPDGNSQNAAYVGMTATAGNSLSSQPIVFNYTDSGGTKHSPQLLATPNGLQTTAGALIPGSANSTALGLPSLPWGTIYGTQAVISDTSTTNQSTLTVSAANDSQGASIQFAGNGGTTPNKWIRAHNGNLEFVNSGFSAIIGTMTDSGSLALNGGLNNTPVGNTTPSTGAFTTLSATNPVGVGSYFNVFNSMTAAQISDVQACTYTQDVKSVIQTALNTYGAIFLPKGCYRTSGPIDNTNGVMVGAGAHQSIIKSYDSTAADSVITAGGAAVIRDLGIGFNSSIITGTETQGQRVGIQTYSPVSSLAMQRGSVLTNLFISYTGTGIYNPNTTTASMFSAQVMNLEINGYSYRGIDIEGSTQTGSVFENLYISNNNGSNLFTTSADAGAVFGQCSGTSVVANTDISEVAINQLNVEWATVANAIRFCGVTGAHVGTVHIEEITLRSNFSGLWEWRNSSGRIGSLSVYYTPITTSGWYVMRVFDAANLTANAASLYNESFVDIGVLNLHGLNDGPQVLSGNGLSAISNFYLFDREVGALGGFVIKLNNYVWQSYQSDTAVYSSAPNDPHSMLFFMPMPSGFNYAPVASSCGTGPTIASGSNAYAGSVTVGTSGTACTLTFPGSGFPNNANGTVVDKAGSVPPYSITKTAITISTATAGHTYSWSVNGN